MNQRCLIVADDLTGGADTGVHFVQKGFRTLLLPSERCDGLDLSGYGRSDVLVLNTESRGLKPKAAYSAVAAALKTYDKSLFPIIYKKIDSTLRGNIGCEIDAILEAAELPLAFVAPSLPGQNRTLVGGIMMVAGTPVALTEMARDAVFPVRESYVCRLLRRRTRNRVGWIDLPRVCSGGERLKEAIAQAREKGARIIVFDAVRNEDLACVVDAALSLDRVPLLVGSAGLAAELANRISPSPEVLFSTPGRKPLKNFLVISGSASGVTRRQLEKLEMNPRVRTFTLDGPLLEAKNTVREFAAQIIRALGEGRSAVLKMSSERVSDKSRTGLPVHAGITRSLGSIAQSVLLELAPKCRAGELALVLTGGETAASVLGLLGVESLEIREEILGGIVLSKVCGGNLAGLGVITKAGAFGREDALEKVFAAAGASVKESRVEAVRALVDEPASSKPLLAITMGDGTGAGPEIIVKSLEDRSFYDRARLFVIGDAKIMQRAAKIVGSGKTIRTVHSPEGAGEAPDFIDVLDLDNLPAGLPFAVVDGRAGKAAYEYVEKAVGLAMTGKIDGIVTAPLNKEALNLGGYHFAGHTEILAKLSGTADYAMMLVSGPLRVIHVTTHVSMRQACDLIRRERISRVIELAVNACRLLGFSQPRVAVAGLNPHSGEGGLFGTEEIEEIVPAIELARGKGYDVSGPIPPDTVFHRAALKQHFDIVVCMYHDQGHIPIKVLGMETGVNVTVGLPFIRTSVDHGTVFGKAGKGTADHRSMNEAIMLALRMARRKKDRP